MFDKWQAQRWWGENYDRIVELYNVQRFNRQALQTPGGSEDQVKSSISYRFVMIALLVLQTRMCFLRPTNEKVYE